MGIEKAIVFGVYNNLQQFNLLPFACGAVSGFMTTCITCPYEKIKILSFNLSVKIKDELIQTKINYIQLIGCIIEI